MTERDPEQVRAFVEQLALIFTDWGFPRMPSRVLITLMAADEEALTAAELAERLEVSPAAISGAVRYLIHIGMLQRVPTPGSRRDRYRLPVDPWYESASLRDGYMSQVVAASGDGRRGARRGHRGRPADRPDARLLRVRPDRAG